MAAIAPKRPPGCLPPNPTHDAELATRSPQAHDKATAKYRSQPLHSPAMSPDKDPINAILSHPEDAVLAVITRVQGPSYRPVGALMAVFGDGTRIGSLSSGCVEQDVALHACAQLTAGAAKTLRYGRGSPFMDIQLPCGGGLEILLIPRPDRHVLRNIITNRAARRPCTIEIDTVTGALTFDPSGVAGTDGTAFRLRFVPDLQFQIYGKGPEASTFAGLVHAAGYPNILQAPDAETRDAVTAQGGQSRALSLHSLPSKLDADPWTAIILFFHDHDWEPPILRAALASDAFYIGAQGSQRARDTRLAQLEELGIDRATSARLFGPVGLIPSARDPGTLAVSVLAEILAVAGQKADEAL